MDDPYWTWWMWALIGAWFVIVTWWLIQGVVMERREKALWEGRNDRDEP